MMGNTKQLVPAWAIISDGEYIMTADSAWLRHDAWWEIQTDSSSCLLEAWWEIDWQQLVAPWSMMHDGKYRLAGSNSCPHEAWCMMGNTDWLLVPACVRNDGKYRLATTRTSLRHDAWWEIQNDCNSCPLETICMMGNTDWQLILSAQGKMHDGKYRMTVIPASLRQDACWEIQTDSKSCLHEARCMMGNTDCQQVVPPWGKMHVGKYRLTAVPAHMRHGAWWEIQTGNS